MGLNDFRVKDDFLSETDGHVVSDVFEALDDFSVFILTTAATFSINFSTWWVVWVVKSVET